MKTWGDVFDHHKAKGMDWSDAAFRADEWEKRRGKMPSWEETKRMLATARNRIEELEAEIARLTKKANFNEGLRDVAMRDNAIKDRQVAAKDHELHMSQMGETVGKDIIADLKAQIARCDAIIDKRDRHIDELEAQIAAKDAALRELREQLFYPNSRIIPIIDAALAPARETT